MKRFLLLLVSAIILIGPSVSLAAETTPPPVSSTPVTSVKLSDTKSSVTIEPPPNDSFVCPMAPGGMGAGNVYFKKQIMPFNESANPEKGKFFKFRFNQNHSNCCQGSGLFRWIGMGIKMIAFLLFWVLLIVFMVVLIRWLLKPHHHHFSSCCQSNSGAVDILNERYAKGEITSEQFDEMKTKLTH